MARWVQTILFVVVFRVAAVRLRVFGIEGNWAQTQLGHAVEIRFQKSNCAKAKVRFRSVHQRRHYEFVILLKDLSQGESAEFQMPFA